MRRTLIRRLRPGTALLALGVLASAVVEVGSGPGLAHKQYSAAKAPAASKPQLVEAYGKLPLSFEANQGQTDRRVDFLTRGSGYSLFLTPTEAVLALRKPVASSGPRTRHTDSEAEEAPAVPPAVVRMKLVGANPSPQVSELEELPGKSNYFVGNNPDKWRTNVPHYTKVQYKDVYPGVDLVYYGNQRQLEYDFVVGPGTDPDGITLGFEGVERLRIDAQGDLLLETQDGEIRQHKPLVYQEVDGVRREIAGSYVLSGRRQVGFQVAAYDAGQPLIIDPVLVYSTYLGGNSPERGRAITVDSSGNAYVTGDTSSTNFPTASPFQGTSGGGFNDAFVTKFNLTGNGVVYSTFLGGSTSDVGTGIVVDGSGNAYVTGSGSTDFPTASPIQATSGGSLDAFVTKLNPTGSALVYSTLLGGSGAESGSDIAIDSSGNAYVTGSTPSTDFPTVSPIQSASGGGNDAFVAKVNAAGSAFVYSTYLGGSSTDQGTGVAADASGNAYLTGLTLSTNFPTASPLQATTGGFFDAYVTKLNAAGSAYVYSTYLGGVGGSFTDFGNDIAVDASGNAYVVGRTDSTNFPTASPLQSANGGGDDAFVAKLNPGGSALVYSTYLGGSGAEDGLGIAIDSSGNVYVAGHTDSTDLPTVDPVQATNGGSDDAFVAKLNPGGSALVYSTYLGGSAFDMARGIAVDSSGNAYVTGDADSTNFPTVNPFMDYIGGDTDGFVSKIGQALTPPPPPPPCTYSISPTSASFPASGGTGSVLISTRCGWNARSDVSWITITSGTSGGGTNRVEYEVAANPDPGSRLGTLTISGEQILTVTQAGTAPAGTLTVMPLELSFSGLVGAAAASRTLQVSSDGGPVNWTAAVTLLNGED